MLGILTLDTRFPRIPGDVGAPGTFAFPVRIATVAGADVGRVVHQPDDTLLERFIHAARALRDVDASASSPPAASLCAGSANWRMPWASPC